MAALLADYADVAPIGSTAAGYTGSIGKKIVTQIIEAGPWWEAEEYHQKYLFNNPSGYQCPNHRLHW